MGGISVASERLRAQPAILYYRGLNKGIPVVNRKERRSIEVEMANREMARGGAVQATACPNLDEQEGGAIQHAGSHGGGGRCIFEFFRRLGTRWKKLGCHQWMFRVRHLGNDPRFAIENSGQSHEGERSTSRTLDGAIAHAIAILTEIRRRQGDVLHCGECHWPTSNVGAP